MDDIFTLALVMATLGQIGLCASVLLTRSLRTPAYLPLVFFLIASAVITPAPVMMVLAPERTPEYIGLLLPALLLLGPALWLYAEGLTSETPWQLRRRHGPHFILPALGLGVAVMTATLSPEQKISMFVDGKESGEIYSGFVILCFFLLLLAWLPQSTWYVVRIFRQLSRYRDRLKALFASNEHRELRWFGWLLFSICGVWLLAFVTIISDNFFDRRFVDGRVWAVIWFLLIWSLAIWGLRQKPGFEGRYLERDANTTDIETSEKYQRSALGPEQAQRIADKIEVMMRRDQLYLDPNLSLHKLSRHVMISPNYVSQVLNETIGDTFFDYVNRWRIDDAKPMIMAGEETVLAIALTVGFNSRSSFYKAFKRETGQTPRGFRGL